MSDSNNSDSQYRAPHRASMLTFDESGAVPSAGFDFDALDGPEDSPAVEESQIRQEAFLGLLQLIADKNASVEEVGRRALLLAYIVKASDCRTQAELAKRMKLTPGRISQILNITKRKFAALYRLPA